MRNILITGGLGFIGSAVVRHLMRTTNHHVIVVDSMTYAAMPEAVAEFADSPRYTFERGDICNRALLLNLLETHTPSIVMHLAAESHVDRSIDGPAKFVQTNVVGTVELLEACRAYLDFLPHDAKQDFRLHHISTDEVFGSLTPNASPFTEESRYDPRSPYSASKAASDHFVRAWGETYGLPIVMSNCSNNYGPWQYPEKLIPLMIAKGVDQKAMPVYGNGENVRDWLHVEDHAEALWLVASQGKLGENYNVGGASERTNLDVVKAICDLLDTQFSNRPPHRDLISFVTDRPGHDFRYAVNFDRIQKELGWSPRHNFETGLVETVKWYMDNEVWWRAILNKTNGAHRLGLTKT
ncbi:MAG: dTDP-glucose 4,6-dehydratase [Litorimonas sp.]